MRVKEWMQKAARLCGLLAYIRACSADHSLFSENALLALFNMTLCLLSP